MATRPESSLRSSIIACCAASCCCCVCLAYKEVALQLCDCLVTDRGMARFEVGPATRQIDQGCRLVGEVVSDFNSESTPGTPPSKSQQVVMQIESESDSDYASVYLLPVYVIAAFLTALHVAGNGCFALSYVPK
ncbi:hypothetical protein JKP88DRAFT_241650 [Tribonema minus]|uniref:Uncharacterized protein n=1 Tax=Tribonema minus TaxID=303371 RepID=A0A835Z368_9STRA|nr:hypothetical protein JKP88DRAFT_241650 [Tribonema minus]